MPARQRRRRDRRHVNAAPPHVDGFVAVTHMKAKYLFSLVTVTVMYFTIAVLLSPQGQAFFT